MLSFNSISAVGKNGAIVHYDTDEGEDLELKKDKMLLLDAGAQYQDCTTDITRTHHYGNPTSKEKVRLHFVSFPSRLINNVAPYELFINW